MNMTIFDIMTWSQNKLYNPRTQHKIKLNSKTYNTLSQQYIKYFPNNYTYVDSIEDRDVISYELFWVETNGIKNIVYKNIDDLVLYQDNNMIVHCFERKTLEYMKHYNITNHPITNEPLPLNIFEKVNSISVRSNNISDKAKNIFNLLTNISIFIDSELFLKLTNKELDKLYYETREFYSENLIDSIKNNLNIFTTMTNKYSLMKTNEKQEYILNCYEKLLKYDQQLYISNYIIVGGLSTVIPKIKELYPDIAMNF